MQKALQNREAHSTTQQKGKEGKRRQRRQKKSSEQINQGAGQASVQGGNFDSR